MNGPLERLTREFLDWVARRPRTYAQAMDAWRTSCPRLTVWEDALTRRLIRMDRTGTRSDPLVVLTPNGHAALAARDDP